MPALENPVPDPLQKDVRVHSGTGELLRFPEKVHARRSATTVLGSVDGEDNSVCFLVEAKDIGGNEHSLVDDKAFQLGPSHHLLPAPRLPCHDQLSPSCTHWAGNERAEGVR